MTRDRIRADLLLVEQGHFESRARAQAAIAAGLVRADGRPVTRASERLPATAAIAATAPHPFVSRGGLKLEAGLDGFGFDPAGLPCLDIGASTGEENGASPNLELEDGAEPQEPDANGEPS